MLLSAVLTNEWVFTQVRDNRRVYLLGIGADAITNAVSGLTDDTHAQTQT